MELAHTHVEELVFSTLLESAVPVAIFSWRATDSWPVEFVSPNVSHVLGYNADDFLSGRVVYAKAVHPDDLPRVTREVAEHSAAGELVFEHEDYRIIDPQGQTRWVRDLTAIIRDPEGRASHYIGYIFESTARHQALEALALAKREAEAASRAKTEFLTNVSHEFRTPLTLILSPLDDLLASNLEAPQRGLLETVRRNARRLQTLVNTLLEFAPIDEGRAHALFEPTDLVSLTRDVASFFDSAAKAAGLGFTVDPAPLEEPAWVDRGMWEKIVSNLLSNALKFTLSGHIRVQLSVVGDQFRLAVEDTGAGIPEEEIPRLFERFHRVKGTPARSQEGSGIGLPLVFELAKLHGGAVNVRSAPGVGSTFTVAIPRGCAHLPKDQVSTAQAPGTTPHALSTYAMGAAAWMERRELTGLTPPPAAAQGRPRVVLADDNADMRNYVKRMLASGYEVEAYANGKDALLAIQQRRPDIVITDVMMPVMGGFELLAALRRDVRTRALPIVMLSARAGEQARAEGIEAGADDYMVKPFSARELLARVGTQWALAQMRQQSERAARLEVEQEWLGAALDRMPFPMALMEPTSGRFTFANRAAHAMAWGSYPLNIPRPEHPGHYRITDEFDRELPLADWPASRAARGEKVEGAMVVWHTSAGRFPLLVSAETLPAMGGHPAAVVIAFRDVSELVRAIRARDEFLSIASHELKTPLTSLKMQVQVRERALAAGNMAAFSAQALAQMVSSDVRQVDRLTRLVDDVLDVSRISAGRFVLTLGEPFDLAAAVRDLLERSDAALAAAGSRVMLDAPHAVVGQWDRPRVEQVLLNLLTNAMKYGRGRPIHCAVHQVQDRAVLTLRDEGIGIAPLDQERIFRVYERAVSANEVSGLGLGLYIARRIVEAHGGSIRVASQPGTGAVFTVELPIAPPSLVRGLP